MEIKIPIQHLKINDTVKVCHQFCLSIALGEIGIVKKLKKFEALVEFKDGHNDWITGEDLQRI